MSRNGHTHKARGRACASEGSDAAADRPGRSSTRERRPNHRESRKRPSHDLSVAWHRTRRMARVFGYGVLGGERPAAAGPAGRGRGTSPSHRLPRSRLAHGGRRDRARRLLVRLGAGAGARRPDVPDLHLRSRRLRLERAWSQAPHLRADQSRIAPGARVGWRARPVPARRSLVRRRTGQELRTALLDRDGGPGARGSRR